MSIEYVIGDCRDVLKQLPDKSVQCCVTSPPYFGLRNYNHPDQIGLEQTPDEYVLHLVEVFREVRRALRDDGTVWLNLGDSYSGSGKGGQSESKRSKNWQPGYANHGKTYGLKNKDLIGIPWRVAFALQADGWYLRQDIIWSKSNPMPESVKDRCTKAHEYVFLLSKNAKYYYDADAVKEPYTDPLHIRIQKRGTNPKYQNTNTKANHLATQNVNGRGRNKRSVWHISTTPYKGAHFATFPIALAEPCILAGCPINGTVLDPFGGSGTVGEVCRLNQRNAILIELNPEYEPLIKTRICAENPELTAFVEGRP